MSDLGTHARKLRHVCLCAAATSAVPVACPAHPWLSPSRDETAHSVAAEHRSYVEGEHDAEIVAVYGFGHRLFVGKNRTDANWRGYVVNDHEQHGLGSWTRMVPGTLRVEETPDHVAASVMGHVRTAGLREKATRETTVAWKEALDACDRRDIGALDEAVYKPVSADNTIMLLGGAK